MSFEKKKTNPEIKINGSVINDGEILRVEYIEKTTKTNFFSRLFKVASKEKVIKSVELPKQEVDKAIFNGGYDSLGEVIEDVGKIIKINLKK